MSERPIGSVEVTSSGRARVRLTLPGIGRKTVDTFASEEEANAYRREMVTILEGDLLDEGGATLSTFGEALLTKRELSGKIRDPGSDWSRWNNHVKDDPLASMAIRAIRDVHLEEWLERLEEKGLARQTRQNCLNVVRTVLRRARKKHLTKDTPWVGVRIAPEPRTKEPWTYASPEEQEAMIAAAPGPLDAIVEFAIGSGLRAGELLGRVSRIVHATWVADRL